jgi:SagB-type dehydrogenase family enzyme
MIPLEDPTTLSQLFHLNSEPWLNDEAYRGAAMNQELKVPAGIIAEVALPEPGNSGLSELFETRRSCREFARREMPLGHLSALLSAGYGAIAPARFNGQTAFLRRTVPSAGGLFPLELYAFTQRVQSLDDGLYHYDVVSHSLQQLHRGNLFPTLEPMFYTYPFMRDANLVVAMAAVFLRTQKKYGPRGYRYTLMEAGHVAQNVSLRAVELGLATLCMGGFLDSLLNELLGLQPREEGVIYTVAAGFDAGGNVPDAQG